MYKKITLCILYSLSVSGLQAQRGTLAFRLGALAHTNQRLFGPTAGLDYNRYFGENWGIGLFFEQAFAEGRSGFPDQLTKNYLFRDYTNLNPTPSLLQWQKTNFPQIRLESKPNRHFNVNLGMQYWYEVYKEDKHTLRTGAGAIMGFHNYMKLTKWIPGAYYADLGGFRQPNALVPLFRYDTYWDLGMVPFVEYRRMFSQRGVCGARAQYYWFPKSGVQYVTTGAFVGFRL